MNPIPIDRLAKLVGGEAVGFAPGTQVVGFATDDRKVESGSLFLAIKGAKVDGHDFAASAVAAGAAGALVERPVPAPHVLVPNLVEALSKLAASYRERFSGPVVGITGSAGKTTTKEFVAGALSPLGRVLKTEGNRNTEYTSPLLWTELTPETKAVVVEMAMRGFGQIKHLASFSKPTVGVITNIGYSHLSEVGTRQGIARAKGELLESLEASSTAVLWAEDEFLSELKAMAPSPIRTFGFSESADCRILSYEALSWTKSRITVEGDGLAVEVEVPAVGRHVALGACAALLVSHILGVSPDKAVAGLASAQLPPMRMEVTELNGAVVLLDTYNAAPPSMLAAIQTFGELPCQGRKLAVIGEMRELGSYSDDAHRELGRALVGSGIDEVVFYGAPTTLAAEEARMRGMVVHLARSHTEIAEFLRRAGPGDGVLVKGSRSLELEKALAMAQTVGGGTR